MTDAAAAARRFLDPSLHPASLVRLAAHYLSAGEAGPAFMFADRRCRISPLAGGLEIALRGKCLQALGEVEAARSDYRRAFELDPSDPIICQSLLESGLWEEPAELIKGVIASPRASASAVQTALLSAFKTDYRIVIRAWRDADRLRGWACWGDDRAIAVGVRPSDDDTAEPIIAELAPNPVHPFSRPSIYAADFAVPLAQFDRGPFNVFLADPPLATSLTHVDDRAAFAFSERDRASVFPTQDVSIIVPVFDEIDMTRQCIEQALKQKIKRGLVRVFAINDNPENAGVGLLLKSFRTDPRFRLIENRKNVGFAASINRALDEIKAGDVLLLNSDAILPGGGALERLRAAAYSASDIGTVTPLSNNGELTSSPTPFRANPLGTLSEIEAIDLAVSLENVGQIVTIPNGVGFCLYIKREALECVDRLSLGYGRGYYEDVDFCFRLKERGFRNICAADVYVGHQGAASFKASKRALVIKNGRILTGRFPAHKLETAAFVEADPLAAARLTVARAQPMDEPAKAVVLFGSANDPGLRFERALFLAEKGLGLFTLDWVDARGKQLVLREGPGGAVLHFDTDRKGAEALAAYCAQQKIEAIEYVRVDREVHEFLTLLKERGLLLSRLFDALPLGMSRLSGECETFGSPCAKCVGEFSKRLDREFRQGHPSLNPFTPAADRAIVATNRVAAAAAQRLGIKTDIQFIQARTRDERSLRGDALGLLLPNVSLEAQHLMLCLTRLIARQDKKLKIVTLGSTMDDLRLMAEGDMFSTGEISAEEYQSRLHLYGVGALLWPFRSKGFGFADRLAEQTGYPLAYFDWSFGATTRRPHDLALDPRSCDRSALLQVLSWAPTHLRRP